MPGNISHLEEVLNREKENGYSNGFVGCLYLYPFITGDGGSPIRRSDVVSFGRPEPPKTQ
jgi:hypothetical protein